MLMLSVWENESYNSKSFCSAFSSLSISFCVCVCKSSTTWSFCKITSFRRLMVLSRSAVWAPNICIYYWVCCSCFLSTAISSSFSLIPSSVYSLISFKVSSTCFYSSNFCCLLTSRRFSSSLIRLTWTISSYLTTTFVYVEFVFCQCCFWVWHSTLFIIDFVCMISSYLLSMFCFDYSSCSFCWNWSAISSWRRSLAFIKVSI